MSQLLVRCAIYWKFDVCTGSSVPDATGNAIADYPVSGSGIACDVAAVDGITGPGIAADVTTVDSVSGVDRAHHVAAVDPVSGIDIAAHIATVDAVPGVDIPLHVPLAGDGEVAVHIQGRAIVDELHLLRTGTAGKTPVLAQGVSDIKHRPQVAVVFPWQIGHPDDLRLCRGFFLPLKQSVQRNAEQISQLGQAEASLGQLRELEQVLDFSIRKIDLATGTVVCALGFPEKLFYEILSSKAGLPIENDSQLLALLTELSAVKQEYDKISDALSSVKATGYGIVMPSAEEMQLEKPEILRKNGAYGVKLRAGAPSIHMIRVDIDTEISPMVGSEQQSQDLISYLTGEAPEKLWESNIFGKSVYELIREGLSAKVIRLPEDVRSKFRSSLTRIVNEGATGLICLIL